MLTPCSSIDRRACRADSRRRRLRPASVSAVCSLLSVWRAAVPSASEAGWARRARSSAGTSEGVSAGAWVRASVGAWAGTSAAAVPVAGSGDARLSGAARKYMTRSLPTTMRKISRESSSTTSRPRRLEGRKLRRGLRRERSRTSRRDLSSSWGVVMSGWWCRCPCPDRPITAEAHYNGGGRGAPASRWPSSRSTAGDRAMDPQNVKWRFHYVW